MNLTHTFFVGFLAGGLVGIGHQASHYFWVKRGMATWRRDVCEPWSHAIELDDAGLNTFFEKESADITHWIFSKNPLVWIRERNRKWGVQKLVGDESHVEVMQ